MQGGGKLVVSKKSTPRERLILTVRESVASSNLNEDQKDEVISRLENVPEATSETSQAELLLGVLQDSLSELNLSEQELLRVLAAAMIGLTREIESGEPSDEEGETQSPEQQIAFLARASDTLLARGIDGRKLLSEVIERLGASPSESAESSGKIATTVAERVLVHKKGGVPLTTAQKTELAQLMQAHFDNKSENNDRENAQAELIERSLGPADSNETGQFFTERSQDDPQREHVAMPELVTFIPPAVDNAKVPHSADPNATAPAAGGSPTPAPLSNRAPAASPATLTVTEDTTANSFLVASDPDGDNLSFIVGRVDPRSFTPSPPKIRT